MNRSILTCVLVASSCGLLCAQQNPQQPAQQQPQQPQQTTSSDPYSGVSNPPSDDTIVATQPDQPKPPAAKSPAGKPLVQPAPAQPTSGAQPAPSSVDPNANFPNPDATGTDNGTVSIAPAQPASASGLVARDASADPDGDIVHPHPDSPGTLAVGTSIRVRLLTGLSTTTSQRGDEFRSRVASDVLQDGQVLIPTGAEIDGRVVEVSRGTSRSRGIIRLRPDWVILSDGSKFRLDAQVTGTPGSNTHVGSEGTIAAGSRYKRDGLEYGGGVGVGVVTGAVIGGPAGAVAGGLIGAGAVTAHLMLDHSEANLEPGTVLIFSLNDRLNLQPSGTAGN